MRNMNSPHPGIEQNLHVLSSQGCVYNCRRTSRQTHTPNPRCPSSSPELQPLNSKLRESPDTNPSALNPKSEHLAQTTGSYTLTSKMQILNPKQALHTKAWWPLPQIGCPHLPPNRLYTAINQTRAPKPQTPNPKP